MKHLFSTLLGAKCANKVAISRQDSQMETANSMLSQLIPRGLTSTSSKPVFWRAYCLALSGALGMSGGAAFAKSPVLNPAQLGTFCPPGSELADARHTDILSIQEQAQIKKSVQGFMALDAHVRRSFGHPLGPQAYWEKGYTAKFDAAKDVPNDWVRYIAYRHSNTCADRGMAFAIILLDVADMAGRKIEKPLTNHPAYSSPQSYWDAFSKVAVVLPEKEATPEQSVLFTVMPLYKNGYGDWLIEQKKVPTLRKIIKTELRGDINRINKSYQCDAPIQRSPSACASNEQERQLLIKYSRPAWSVYPKDMKLGIASHQSVKP